MSGRGDQLVWIAIGALLLGVLFVATALSGCAADVAPAQTVSACDPPTFTEMTCFDPGGGVIRCLMADGTYWDNPPTGRLVHWQCTAGNSPGGACFPAQVVTLCVVEPK